MSFVVDDQELTPFEAYYKRKWELLRKHPELLAWLRWYQTQKRMAERERQEQLQNHIDLQMEIAYLQDVVYNKIDPEPVKPSKVQQASRFFDEWGFIAAGNPRKKNIH